MFIAYVALITVLGSESAKCRPTGSVRRSVCWRLQGIPGSVREREACRNVYQRNQGKFDMLPLSWIVGLILPLGFRACMHDTRRRNHRYVESEKCGKLFLRSWVLITCTSCPWYVFSSLRLVWFYLCVMLSGHKPEEWVASWDTWTSLWKWPYKLSNKVQWGQDCSIIHTRGQGFWSPS